MVSTRTMFDQFFDLFKDFRKEIQHCSIHCCGIRNACGFAMKVEISKEQKEALGQKIAMCVDFLKSEVQVHMVKSDTIIVSMGDFLDLYISCNKIYVTETKVLNLGFDFYRKRTYYLEKLDPKKAKRYICDAAPELAVDFLKNWEPAKNALIAQVSDKKKKVNALNEFVDGFQL